MHFGFFNNQDANDYGVPTNFTMLPESLKTLGRYRTHMIGKWYVRTARIRLATSPHILELGCSELALILPPPALILARVSGCPMLRDMSHRTLSPCR